MIFKPIDNEWTACIFSMDAENYSKYSQETVCIFNDIMKGVWTFGTIPNTEIYRYYYHNIFDRVSSREIHRNMK